MASGDPGPDSVVLWTRLIGELPGGVPLLWEVAHDEGFVDLAATGLTEATADFAHSAHVIVTGRNAKDELIEIADLVTEMEMIKHPFRSGVKAQQGIEF